MNRRRAQVALSLLGGLLVAFLGFRWLNRPLRDLEAAAVVEALRGAGTRVDLVNGYAFQVLPNSGLPFRAVLTPYCSSVIALLALTVISVFVLHAPWPRRLVALAASLAVVLAGNILRIAVSLWLGDEFGVRWLVLFHDWVGTFFALGYTMLGFFLMLFLLLPSSRASIPRAARVSDVL